MIWLTPTTVFVATAHHKKVNITADVDTRLRFERRIDRDFNRTNSDNRSELLLRVRPGVTAKLAKWSARLQWQLAESVVWTPQRNFSATNSDATVASIMYTDGPQKVTVGRQKIGFADERLIGPLEWINLSRSMDGVRFQNASWDVFAFRIGLAPNRPRDQRMAGVVHNHRYGTTAYLLKTDKVGADDVTIHTLNHVWKEKVNKGFRTEIEIAGQIGKIGSRDLAAFAAHGRATWQLNAASTVAVEANLASGGQSAGHIKTFDNLLPTNHKFYGAMDTIGWRNMEEVTLLATHKTDPKGSITFGWHNFWLFDATDGWYSAGGPINARAGGLYQDPTGSSGRHLGTEFDLQYSRVINPSSTLTCGIAVFQPGGFVKSFNPGASRNQVWAYGALTYKF